MNEYEIVSYVKDNPVMVLGTVNASGHPHGAAIYVCATAADQLYFITKTDTQKFKNIEHNPNVSVTIVNPDDNTTLQAQGKASVVESPVLLEEVMAKMTRIYARSPDWLPPIAKLHAGPYQVVGIKLSNSRLAHFKDTKPGSPHIFKEL